MNVTVSPMRQKTAFSALVMACSSAGVGSQRTAGEGIVTPLGSFLSESGVSEPVTLPVNVTDCWTFCCAPFTHCKVAEAGFTRNPGNVNVRTGTGSKYESHTVPVST